MSDIFVYLLER